MLTSEQIMGLVNNLGRAGTPGRIQALRRSQRTASGTTTMTPAQERFLAAAESVQPGAGSTTYAHPQASAMIRRTPGGQAQATPLTSSQIAWLQRLPSDPAQVPFSDAERVLAMALGPLVAEDRPLVQSIADPIRQYHDMREAQTELGNAQRSAPQTPQEALPALADAVAAENDQLEPHEAVARASELLRTNGQQRAQEKAWQVGAAQERIDKLNQAAADRVAVHR